MTIELIEYIITYYTHLFTDKENVAYKYYNTIIKDEESEPYVKNTMLRHLGTNDSETLKLLDNGYENFIKNVAKRILKEKSDDIVINNCPDCGKLARTPKAKQCRFCGFDWFNKRNRRSMKR